MTEPITAPAPAADPLPLDQATVDKLLKTIKDKAGDALAEMSAEFYAKQEKNLEERFEAQLAKANSEKELRELGNGKNAIGTVFMAAAKANNDGEKITQMLDKQLGSAVTKSLNLQQADSGGILIEGEVLDRWFDVLRPSVAVLSRGPQVLPMPTGSLQYSGFTGDMTSFYVGEPNTTAIESQPTTGARMLNAKNQMTLVPITQNLLNTPAGPRVANFVERSARRNQAVRQDLALLRSAGTDFEPKGLTNWAGNTVNSADQVTPDIADVFTDFSAAFTQLQGDNVAMSNMGIIWAPKTENFLKYLARTGGEDIPHFLAEMRNGTFLGIPYSSTSQMPTNLGGNSDESEIIVADFDSVLYGDVGTMEVEFFRQGSYTSGGNQVSAMERYEQVLRLTHSHDLNVEYTEAVYVIDAVAYGNAS